jgi:pantetheine hydrolase
VYSKAEYNSRDTLLPFLQRIPENWTPCQEDILGSQIFLDLSCIAETYNLTIIANIGTVVWCDKSDDSVCPDDGRYQFNTNVVFDESGLLKTLYHKFNLFGERNFDKPTLEYAEFATAFGTVGVATCFDLLFKEPAVALVEKHGVRAVVLPSYWFNRIPFLAMYEIAEAWAVRMKTYLLVANIHSPSSALVGSGIFGPKGVINYTYVTEESSSGQLVLGRIQSDQGTQAALSTSKPKSSVTFTTQ